MADTQPQTQLPSVRFRREREESWRALEELLGTLESSGARSLRVRELRRLATLHRAALSSLSVARAIALDRNLLDYLENLAARSHCAIHRGGESLLEGLDRFFSREFPSAVRALKWQLALASLLFVLGTAIAHLETTRDLSNFDDYVSENVAQGRDPGSTVEELREILYSPKEDKGALTAFGSFLFTHNTGVGLLSLALGFAAGVPSGLLTFDNGLMLGGFSGLYTARGLGPDFWAWVLPHGVTEILALLLCCAAGFSLGQGLLFAGPHTRLESLKLRGREAGVVALGVVLMFCIAGGIEGVFRQTVLDPAVRCAVAASTALAWGVYFTRVGRR
ncbi:MAG: stage II sporulation protein M [Deltaproteobacteria bacterium]|nr:stage II sporulation protein M [Deltaproteobacteria bacterium]